jgi:dihydroorotate dehydrogenase
LNLILKIIKFFPPELAHSIALYSLNILYKLNILNLFFTKVNTKNHEIFGLNFSNKLGTAAGLDKNGDFIDCLGALGFGFLEVGTITPLPQSGNPKPRVFRIPKEQAVINRLGFNNKGIDHLINNLKSRKFEGVVGVNIGANKNSAGQDRINDYLVCLRKVAGLCDYLTINISSPNTPGLRDFHNEENISNLINAIEEEANITNFKGPIFIKISPDEQIESIMKIAEIVFNSSMSGLIISNTTLDRNLLKDDHYKHFNGGLSGAPLMVPSTKILKSIKEAFPKLNIIGVGGVMSKDDFDIKINAGAELVQIYTGFIYNGPKIVQDILN